MVLALMVLGACTSPFGPQQDELSDARARWSSQGPETYLYDLQRLCFCGGDALRVARILVSEGQVVSGVWVESGEPITDYPFGELPTVEDLFAEIQDAIDRDAYSLEVEYHEQRGFPIYVAIDYSPNIADEEMAFEVSALEEVAVQD